MYLENVGYAPTYRLAPIVKPASPIVPGATMNMPSAPLEEGDIAPQGSSLATTTQTEVLHPIVSAVQIPEMTATLSPGLATSSTPAALSSLAPTLSSTMNWSTIFLIGAVILAFFVFFPKGDNNGG